MRSPAKSEKQGVGGAGARLPLSALLSQVLVAFTIEFDNESDRRIEHWTTRHGSTGGSRKGVWLVSLVMFSNCMQFVGEDGVRVGELEKLARTQTNLNGMERWRYITIEPNPGGWRASVRKAETLPHYPMVLHRGGYPDGS